MLGCPTHLLLPQYHENRDFKLGMAQLGICCSQPADIAVFSLPPALALSPLKCLFFFHFQRDILFKMPNAGLWLLFMGYLFGAAINCKWFEVGSSNCNCCWVLCCFFCRGSFFFPASPWSLRAGLLFSLSAQHCLFALTAPTVLPMDCLSSGLWSLHDFIVDKW